VIEAADHDTIGDSAYRNIRDDIIFGQLRPSEKLRLEPLRKRYNVSVTTLREILNRLTSDGLVVAEGQKGFEVASVSDANLWEVAELRLLVEGHAIARSFASGDLDWESQVVAAHHKLHRLEDRMISGDMSAREDWKRADWGFHRALITGCGSKTHEKHYPSHAAGMRCIDWRGRICSGSLRRGQDHAQDVDAGLGDRPALGRAGRRSSRPPWRTSPPISRITTDR
jgi:DNA-binding GntR family transcriptional regulator